MLAQSDRIKRQTMYDENNNTFRNYFKIYSFANEKKPKTNEDFPDNKNFYLLKYHIKMSLEAIYIMQGD
jgi:hypothetical protein